MTIKIIGIDVGLKGAFAFGEGDSETEEFKIKEIKFFPTIKSKKDYFPIDIYPLIPNDTDLVIIEQPSVTSRQKIPNCAINFKLLGNLEMVMIAKKISYEIVSSNVWRKELIKGIHKTDTKTTAIIACQRIFPNIKLKRTKKSRKDNDNIAEAALLSYYGWLVWNEKISYYRVF